MGRGNEPDMMKVLDKMQKNEAQKHLLETTLMNNTLLQSRILSSLQQRSIFWPKIPIYAPVGKSGKGLFLPCSRGILPEHIFATTENYYNTRKYSA